MVTNAQAWNYLGVADQHAGQPADAVQAYQRALMLNRDLGGGALQSRLSVVGTKQARCRENGIHRLHASPQQRAGRLGQTRRCPSCACMISRRRKKVSTPRFRFDPHNAEALNGLGLAQMQRGRPREAAQYFAAAVQAHPDYGPALLNLATVTQQYLHDNTLALKNYRAYLALSPRQANWDEVNAIANDLEQQANRHCQSAAGKSPGVFSHCRARVNRKHNRRPWYQGHKRWHMRI